jgi:hypothetical protein
MLWLRRPLPALVLSLALACSDALPTMPSQPTEAAGVVSGAGRISVMTRNIYIGADVAAVIAALASPDPADDLPVLLNPIAVLQRTAFPVRAQALADEIARGLNYSVAVQVSNLTAAPLPVITGFGLPFAAS